VRNLKITEKYTVRGTKSMDSYLREVEKTHPMTADKEYEIAMKAQAGDEKAREMLVKSNLRFVISVAKKYSQDPDLVLDLIAVGNLGLIDASKKFDPTKGFKFISFAVWHIRKEILDFLVKHGKTIRVPASQQGILNKINEIRSKCHNDDGRQPTDEEILEYVRANYKSAANLEMSTLKEIMLGDHSVYSLDKPVGQDEDTTILDVYDAGDSSVEKFVMDESIHKTIELLLQPLSHIEREIVKRRHGIGYFMSQEFCFIGDEFNLTAEMIRIRYTRALKKMKIWANKNRISLEGLF
jgi:RNA polymerase primary sigma factor